MWCALVCARPIIVPGVPAVKEKRCCARLLRGFGARSGWCEARWTGRCRVTVRSHTGIVLSPAPDGHEPGLSHSPVTSTGSFAGMKPSLERTQRAPRVLVVEVVAITSSPCRNPRRSSDLGHAELAGSINRAKPPAGPSPVQLDARGVPISRSVRPQLLASLLWDRYTSWGTRADSAPRLRIRLDWMPALASYATATNPASSAPITALSHSPNRPHTTRPGRFSAMPVWVTLLGLRGACGKRW